MFIEDCTVSNNRLHANTRKRNHRLIGLHTPGEKDPGPEVGSGSPVHFSRGGGIYRVLPHLNLLQAYIALTTKESLYLNWGWGLIVPEKPRESGLVIL